MVFSGGEAAQAVRNHQARMIAETQRLSELGPLRALNSWQVKPVVVSGVPHRAILRVAAETQADLIVMGTSRSGGLRELLAGSTSRAVLRRAACPVLLVAEERRGVAGDERVVTFLQRKAS
jgi:nucleotide-binding universal stress UspA family protein